MKVFISESTYEELTEFYVNNSHRIKSEGADSFDEWVDHVLHKFVQNSSQKETPP